MSSCRRIILLIIVLLPVLLSAQKRHKALENLGKFDNRLYHFGVHLSYNNADFFLEQKFDPMFEDSLLSLQHFSRPGFNIAILAELHLNKNVGIRIIPGISPKERILSYTFIQRSGQEKLFEKSIRSFYIDFPLQIKYRTDRINNFAAYVIGGGQYSRDMASQEKVDNDRLAGNDQTIVKIRRNDFSLAAGGGFDFFLPYFKFGIELRMEYGLGNIHLPDDTRFSAPIQSLRSKNFILSFTFEG